MLSTFPATNSSFDPLFSNPFPPFEGGFTPWGSLETAFDFPLNQDQEPVLSLIHEPVQSPNPSPPQEPVISNEGSDSENSNRKPVNSNSGSGSGSGSDDPNRKRKLTNSGSDEAPNRDDERKRRRMISNRESARRSRMRKQKHLENLRNQVNRLRVGNRELMNRARFVTHHCQLIHSENERLRSESSMLRQKLWDIRQVLLVRQLQHQLATTTNTNTNSAWPYINNNVGQTLITR